VFYLNFRWGFSQPYQVAGLEHEVRERDYFFIASFALWGIWVGMGLAAVMEWIEQGLVARQPAVGRRWALATPVLLLALVPLAGVVSDAPLAAPADAVDGPLLPGGSGRLAPGLRGAVAAGDRATRTHRRRARSPHAGAPLPHALRSRGARDRQGSAGQAADLLLDLDGELRRPARPVALPRG